MSRIRNLLLLAFVLIFLLGPISRSPASGTRPPDSVQELAVQLQEHNSKTARDLHRIHRELAALRAEFGKPGLNDIFGGIGYIFGLFGVAAFVASRRKK
ncbi:MAG: hypothetical protein K9K64_08935 [Desulfohalobiaceae bacterium]|nr:hypothetical protein [Desulfohalobiaceae bacterium]